ncbi:MAG: polyhydroxyalkanoic acid system family protein [Myxococcales bacterium]|nr:polyhydroxyalkanoic acid system family protein [Myxococcales bacterium]
MPKIDILHPHTLPLDEAKQKVRALVEGVVQDYPKLNISVDWNPSGLEAKATGRMFKGRFLLDESRVTVNIDLSLLASPLTDRVTNKIRERLSDSFGKAG